MQAPWGGPPGPAPPAGAPPFFGVGAEEVKERIVWVLSRKAPTPEAAQEIWRRLTEDFSLIYLPPGSPGAFPELQYCRRTSRDFEAILELLRAGHPGAAAARPQDLEVYINKTLRYATKEPMRRDEFDFLELRFLRYTLLYGTPEGRQLSALLPPEFLGKVSDNQRYGKVHRLRKKYPRGGAWLESREAVQKAFERYAALYRRVRASYWGKYLTDSDLLPGMPRPAPEEPAGVTGVAAPAAPGEPRGAVVAPLAAPLLTPVGVLPAGTPLAPFPAPLPAPQAASPPPSPAAPWGVPYCPPATGGPGYQFAPWGGL